jgi:hypothetical protein
MVGTVQVEYSSILSMITQHPRGKLSEWVIPFYGNKAIKMPCFKLTAGRMHIRLMDMPKMYFKVQTVRPAKGQYQVNTTAIWESVLGEVNGNILKFLSLKELFRFKEISKSAKTAVESEK